MADQSVTTIPALPCIALDESLRFWQALGFDVTYTQRAPNPYAVIGNGAYDLHLFGLPQLRPEDNWACCLVVVPEVEQLHRSFAERLRAAYGKVPGSGFPRLSRMRPGQTRFTLTDVAGNSVIYVRRGPADAAAADDYKRADQSAMERALSTAARLRDFKNDDAAAAKVLDMALRKHPDAPAVERGRVLLARVELALALGDTALVERCDAHLQALELTETERTALSADRAALYALAAERGVPPA